jgi:hypothetical protein
MRANDRGFGRGSTAPFFKCPRFLHAIFLGISHLAGSLAKNLIAAEKVVATRFVQ